MRNMTGRPVSEEDFYNRKSELIDLWRKLETDHVLLLAPRRVGKTSLMYKLMAEAPHRADTYAIYLSVPDIDTELEFVERLYRAVLESPQASSRLSRVWDTLKSSSVGKFFSRIESVSLLEFEVGWRDAKPEDWETLGRELMHALRNLEGRWLILVDELPVFVLNLIKQDPAAARARTFLYWLRQMRQMPPPEGERLRFLLAGSIGLDTVASRYRMGDTINDLTIKTLGAFSPETADQFLAKLGDDYDLPLSPEVRQRIRERAEWLIPYYLQLFFSGLLEICSDERAVPPSVEMVDEVFDVLLSHGRRSYFDYWHQRLTEELGAPQDGWARTLLNVCSRDAKGASRQIFSAALSQHIADANQRDEMLNWLLDVLAGDGYLVEAEGRYRFRSSLLREFWHRRFAQ